MTIENLLPDIVDLRSKGILYSEISEVLNVNYFDILKYGYALDKCRIILDSISDGAKSVTEISDITDLNPSTIYKYSRMGKIKLPKIHNQGRKQKR